MLENYIYSSNVWTKEIHNPSDCDYCDDGRILQEVRELYRQYRSECNRFINIYRLPEFNPDDRRFYVYAWYTKTDPKKYFYIGKGTKQRYKHILKEIENYRNGINKGNPRFKDYSYLQDKYGIDYEIILDGLSDYEALVYEQALKIHMMNNGEVLLNVEGVSAENLPDGWHAREAVKYPVVENSLFYRRYYNYNDIPSFDAVDIDNLNKIHFYCWGTGREEDATIEETLIRNWISNTSGKIYTSAKAKGVQSIIVFHYLSEERYREYKNLGKQIYSSTDVVNYLHLCLS